MYLPDCAGTITFPAWALHLPTIRSAALSYANKHLVGDLVADPAQVFTLADGSWNVDESIAAKFPRKTFISEENGAILVGGWEPGGDLQNLRDRLKRYGISYDAEKLARGTGENINDEKNYLRFDPFQQVTVKTIYNDNKSTAPTYSDLRDLAAGGRTEDIVRLLDEHLARIGPPSPLGADAPAEVGLLPRLFACYAHAANVDGAAQLVANSTAGLTDAPETERVRILSSINYIFAQGSPDGAGSRLLELCMSSGLKTSPADLDFISANGITLSADFTQRYHTLNNTLVAHRAVASVLAAKSKPAQPQLPEPRAWMHFPAWALWLDNVRFELDRMLQQKGKPPLRMGDCPLQMDGRAFNLDATSARWEFDPLGLPLIKPTSATRFTIENDRVILEGTDPTAQTWDTLQGILSVYHVPMNHLKGDRERHYRYEKPDVEQIHHPARDHHVACTDLASHCLQGAAGAAQLLAVDAPRGHDCALLLKTMPDIMQQMSNEQKYGILASCVRWQSGSSPTITKLVDSGFKIPPGAVEWLQQYYAASAKPQSYDEQLRLIGALQAKQGFNAVISKARSAAP